jgi:hypothetical protein
MASSLIASATGRCTSQRLLHKLGGSRLTPHAERASRLERHHLKALRALDNLVDGKLCIAASAVRGYCDITERELCQR